MRIADTVRHGTQVVVAVPAMGDEADALLDLPPRELLVGDATRIGSRVGPGRTTGGGGLLSSRAGMGAVDAWPLGHLVGPAGYSWRGAVDDPTRGRSSAPRQLNPRRGGAGLIATDRRSDGDRGGDRARQSVRWRVPLLRGLRPHGHRAFRHRGCRGRHRDEPGLVPPRRGSVLGRRVLPFAQKAPRAPRARVAPRGTALMCPLLVPPQRPGVLAPP